MKKLWLTAITATMLVAAPSIAETAQTTGCLDAAGQTVACGAGHALSNHTSQEVRRSPASRTNAQSRSRPTTAPAKQDRHCLNKEGAARLECVKLNAPLGN